MSEAKAIKMYNKINKLEQADRTKEHRSKEVNFVITKEMVEELNNELAVRGYPFRYNYHEDAEHDSIPDMQVTLPNMKGVSSCTIKVTDDFLKRLELWFRTRYGIDLTYLNDRSVLWARRE